MFVTCLHPIPKQHKNNKVHTYSCIYIYIERERLGVACLSSNTSLAPRCRTSLCLPNSRCVGLQRQNTRHHEKFRRPWQWEMRCLESANMNIIAWKIEMQSSKTAYQMDSSYSQLRSEILFYFVPEGGSAPPRPPFKSAWRPPRFMDVFHQIQQE